MIMGAITILQQTAKAIRDLLAPSQDTWGRESDKSVWFGNAADPPQRNPLDDTLDTDVLYDMNNNPFAVAGLKSRNISQYFVSAGGMSPGENGATFPAQLIYTQEDGDPEILEALAKQYDEAFCGTPYDSTIGGFGQILGKLDDTAKREGYCIGENHFVRGDIGPHKDLIWVNMISARDPHAYRFDIDGVSGIYRQVRGFEWQKQDENKFMSFAYDPIFDNPYGRPINFPLMPYLRDFNKNYGYWKHALEKAGMGWIIAHYPERFSGTDIASVNWRSELESQLKKIVSGSWGYIHEAVNLEAMKLDSDLQGFFTWHNAFIQAVSVLYTGSATALTEGKYGSKSMAEATVVRQKSDHEKMDAARISAFFTYKFNRIWCDLNFPPERINGIYPTFQLIPPEMLAPTTPENQETIEVETQDRNEQPEEMPGDDNPELSAAKKAETQYLEYAKQCQRDGKEINPHYFLNTLEPELYNAWSVELQEEKSDKPPVAVPPSFQDFPSETPVPDSFRDATDAAQAWLEDDLEVREYDDTTPDNAATTFTVKRLRNYTSDVLPVLTALKAAIIPTMPLENELQAWNQYYTEAVKIFAANGITMDPAIRGDIKTSFRQARQNAFGHGVLNNARQDPTVTGIEFFNLEDGHTIRAEHKLFHLVRLAIDDSRLEEMLTPWDFGCLCGMRPYSGSDFTQELPPLELLGQTYKYYAV